MEIKVSVITPFFNGLPYLEECVNSVLAQTLPELELILVDDGSTDGSGALADEFAEKDSRVRVIHQPNSGVSSARNAGLELARGEYIGFVDADDFIEPEMFENLYTAAITVRAQIVSTWFKCAYDSDGNPPDKAFLYAKPAFLTHSDMTALLERMNDNQVFHFTWRNIFESAFLESEKIRFNPNISVGEDTLFNMKAMLASAGVLMLPGTPYHYRMHGESAMGKSAFKPLLFGSLTLQYEEKLKLFEKYSAGNIPALLATTAEYNIKTLLPLLLKNAYANNSPDSKSWLKQIFRSKMISDAFAYFDISRFRSKSLDWVMLRFAKNKMYLPAHLICKYILYKK